MIINILLKDGRSALLDCDRFHYMECSNEIIPNGRWFVLPYLGHIDEYGSIHCKEKIQCNDIYQITIADLIEQKESTNVLARPWRYMYYLNKILENNPTIHISFISDKEGLNMVYDHYEDIQSNNTGEEAVTDRQSEEIAEKVKKKK